MQSKVLVYLVVGTGCAPDAFYLILRMAFTPIFALLATTIANKAQAKTPNRIAVIISTVLGLVILLVNYVF